MLPELEQDAVTRSSRSVSTGVCAIRSTRAEAIVRPQPNPTDSCVDRSWRRMAADALGASGDIGSSYRKGKPVGLDHDWVLDMGHGGEPVSSISGSRASPRAAWSRKRARTRRYSCVPLVPTLRGRRSLSVVDGTLRASHRPIVAKS